MDIVQIDNMYKVPDAAPKIASDGAGMRWKHNGVYADVPVSSGSPATDVLAAFPLHDKIL